MLNPLKAVGPQLRIILRSRIISNDLIPASRLSEAEIAREYEVSRQPVREAFITLHNEGLLEIRPQRGTIVRKIDYEAVLDARFVREAVEADIVKLLVREPDSALQRELDKQIKAQRKAADESAQAFMVLDELFHRTLAEAAGKTKAWSYIETIKLQMDRVRFLTISAFPIQTLIAQHQDIVDALIAEDGSAAEQSMRTHLREILQTLPPVQAMYPEFFEQSR